MVQTLGVLTEQWVTQTEFTELRKELKKKIKMFSEMKAKL